MSDAVDDAANCLSDLLEALDMLSNCEGNKAKLELADVAISYFAELQQLCSTCKLMVLVGHKMDDETEEVQA